ncbi:MAG: hypothetical protein ACKPKO_21970 [Candidatus Fonsibacter sp.]
MYIDYVLTARYGLAIGTEGGYNSPVSPSYYKYKRIDKQGNMLTQGTVATVGSIASGSMKSARHISI